MKRTHRPGIHRAAAVFLLGFLGLCVPTSAGLAQNLRRPLSDALCPRGGALRLTLREAVPAPFRIPPAALSRLEDRNYLALARAGQVFSFGAAGLRETAPDGIVMAGLGTIPGASVAFTDRSIYRYAARERAWREVEIVEDFSDLRSVTAAAEAEAIWVVDGSEESATVYMLRPLSDMKPDSGWASAFQVKVAGSWRLIPTAVGHAIAVATRQPFHVVRLTRDGAFPIGSLAKVVDVDESAEPAHVVISGAVALDCAAILVTAADLRSQARWLIVLDSTTGQVIKSRRTNGSLGFFASAPRTKSIFAYRGTKEAGEVLIYGWTWTTERQK